MTFCILLCMLCTVISFFFYVKYRTIKYTTVSKQYWSKFWKVFRRREKFRQGLLLVLYWFINWLHLGYRRWTNYSSGRDDEWTLHSQQVLENSIQYTRTWLTHRSYWVIVLSSEFSLLTNLIAKARMYENEWKLYNMIVSSVYTMFNQTENVRQLTRICAVRTSALTNQYYNELNGFIGVKTGMNQEKNLTDNDNLDSEIRDSSNNAQSNRRKI